MHIFDEEKRYKHVPAAGKNVNTRSSLRSELIIYRVPRQVVSVHVKIHVWQQINDQSVSANTRCLHLQR